MKFFQQLRKFGVYRWRDLLLSVRTTGDLPLGPIVAVDSIKNIF